MNRSPLSILKITVTSLFICILAGYALFQSHKLIVGPVITIYSPQNGAVYNSPLIEVTGRAQNTAFLKLNDRKIFTDSTGTFSEKLLLSPGYNIMVLEAQDKFGKVVSKKLELVLKEY